MIEKKFRVLKPQKSGSIVIGSYTFPAQEGSEFRMPLSQETLDLLDLLENGTIEFVRKKPGD
jgi:hypothetical protein